MDFISEYISEDMRFGRSVANAFTQRRHEGTAEINYSMNISFGSFESKQSFSRNVLLRLRSR